MPRSAQLFDVCEQVLRRIAKRCACRFRLTAATLIEHDHPMNLRIEEHQVPRIRPGSGSAVQRDHRQRIRIPESAPVDLVRLADIQ